MIVVIVGGVAESLVVEVRVVVVLDMVLGVFVAAVWWLSAAAIFIGGFGLWKKK